MQWTLKQLEKSCIAFEGENSSVFRLDGCDYKIGSYFEWLGHLNALFELVPFEFPKSKTSFLDGKEKKELLLFSEWRWNRFNDACKSTWKAPSFLSFSFKRPKINKVPLKMCILLAFCNFENFDKFGWYLINNRHFYQQPRNRFHLR